MEGNYAANNAKTYARNHKVKHKQKLAVGKVRGALFGKSEYACAELPARQKKVVKYFIVRRLDFGICVPACLFKVQRVNLNIVKPSVYYRQT